MPDQGSAKPALLAMIASAGLFFAALVWGVRFGFPEPDGAAATAAALRFHADLSGWIMLAALLAFVASGAVLLRSIVRARRRRAAESCRAP